MLFILCYKVIRKGWSFKVNEIALILSACHLKFPSCSLLCLFSCNFHLENAWQILGTRNKQQPGCISDFSHSCSEAFLEKKKKNVGNKVELGVKHFISTSPHFPREFLWISQDPPKQCYSAAGPCYTNLTCAPSAPQDFASLSRGQHTQLLWRAHGLIWLHATWLWRWKKTRALSFW